MAQTVEKEMLREWLKLQADNADETANEAKESGEAQRYHFYLGKASAFYSALANTYLVSA